MIGNRNDVSCLNLLFLRRQCLFVQFRTNSLRDVEDESRDSQILLIPEPVSEKEEKVEIKLTLIRS